MKNLSGMKQDKAFKELRDLLCSESLLQYPDFTESFVVMYGCIRLRNRRYIESRNDRKELTLAYTSRLLNKVEQNYFTIEKELLAIIYSVQFLYTRPYIYIEENSH